MGNWPSRAQVAHIKDSYPVGCRVALVEMNDLYALPVGTEGTVVAVDDIGTVHINWDNGRRLGAVLGEDVIRRV